MTIKALYYETFESFLNWAKDFIIEHGWDNTSCPTFFGSLTSIDWIHDILNKSDGNRDIVINVDTQIKLLNKLVIIAQSEELSITNQTGKLRELFEKIKKENNIIDNETIKNAKVD